MLKRMWLTVEVSCRNWKVTNRQSSSPVCPSTGSSPQMARAVEK